MRGGLTRRGPVALIACCALAALTAGGCGGGDASLRTSAAAPTPTPTMSAAERERAAARRDRLERIREEKTFAPNPYPAPPDSPPHPHGRITHIQIRDIKRGTGPAITGDETVYVNYSMSFWKSGKRFNLAWGPLRAQYMHLTEEASGIPRGMVGMRPGGRRVILLPAPVSQAHNPDGGPGYVDARVDLVLRKIEASG